MNVFEKMLIFSLEENSEKKLRSIKLIANVMDKIRLYKPKVYKSIEREEAEILFGKHFSEDMAIEQVESLHFLDRNGQKCNGKHWSMEDVVRLTEGKQFPPETTDGDKFVAYNTVYAKLCTALSDEMIIEIADLMFFKHDAEDDDCSIWDFCGINANCVF